LIQCSRNTTQITLTLWMNINSNKSWLRSSRSLIFLNKSQMTMLIKCLWHLTPTLMAIYPKRSLGLLLPNVSLNDYVLFVFKMFYFCSRFLRSKSHNIMLNKANLCNNKIISLLNIFYVTKIEIYFNIIVKLLMSSPS
jgi:hypothetical protein